MRIEKTFSKFTAALLAVIITASILPARVWAGFASQASGTAGDRITVVVLLDDGLSPDEAAAKIGARTNGMKVKYFYRTLINGFAAEIDSADRGLIAAYPGVASLSLDNAYSAPTAALGGETEAGEMYISLRADADYGGEGTVVAVLDSGFDVGHPAFRLTAQSKAAITKSDITSARNSLNAKTAAFVSVKLPFAYDYAGADTDVYSEDAHGTGIAGIIAGNGKGYEGVAPEAQLLLMKVFDEKSGSASESDVIAALEDAVLLGADVINLSLGSPVGADDGLPLDPALGLALDAAAAAGVTVNGAAGNDGHIGAQSEIDNNFGLALPSTKTMDYGTINSPASVGAVTALASKNSDAEYKYCVEFGGRKVPFSDTTANYKELGGKSFTEQLDGKTYAYVAVPGLGSAEDCAAVGEKLSGSVALIKRGGLTFVEKVNNAFKYGAVGVVIWDNIEKNPAQVNMELAGARLPAIFISYEYGAPLAETGSGELKITDKLMGKFPSSDSDRLAATSSWGMTPSFSLKPELTATGMNVYTTMPKNKFAIMDGTSAASAAASGEAAVLIGLLRQKGGDADRTAVKRLFMNSAKPLTDSVTGFYYSPRRQGAGGINAPAAATLKTSLTASATGLAKIELSSLRGTSASLELTLENRSDTAKTYTLSCAVQGDAYKLLGEGEKAVSADLCEPRAFSGASATLDGGEINLYSDKYSGVKVTVDAGKSAALSVQITLDSATAAEYGKIFTNGFYLEGFIFAESDGGGERVSLPFVCFTGDWDSMPIFDSTVYEAAELSYYLSSCFYGESADYSLNVIMGLNQYVDGYYFNKSCVSFSPDGNGELDTLRLSIALLRSARKITGMVTGPDGEVVADMGRLAYISKTLVREGALSAFDFEVWDGSDDDNPYYIFPDGAYTLTICAYPAFEGSKMQKFEFAFTLDTIKPRVTSKKLETAADGSETLVLGVTDETALQGAQLYLSDAGFYTGQYAAAHTDGAKKADTYTFDVTGWKKNGQDYVYVDIFDYAMNRATVKISLAALAGGSK